MQKILRKRVFRDLKKNIWRYLALFLLIVLGMYIVVSMVGAAETIITSTANKAELNNVEDGEFETFIPLSSKDEESITSKGVTLEKMFYEDFQVDGDKKLRIYRDRNNINKVCTEEGKQSLNDKDILIEKRFSEENSLSVGDTVKISDMSFTVCGIVTSPDYDAPFDNISDMNVDSNKFGVGFVSNDDYDKLLLIGKAIKTEAFSYAYKLPVNMSHNELKNELMKIKVDPHSIKDEYFQEYWQRTGGEINDLVDGVKELSNGGTKLYDSLTELDKNSSELNNSSSQLLSEYLKEANKSLKEYGLTKELTEDNFKEELNNLEEKSDNPFLNLNIISLRDTLVKLKQYKDGVSSYTGAVGSIKDGSLTLKDNLGELNTEVDKYVNDEMDVELPNLTSFVKNTDNPRIGAAADDQVINKYAGIAAGIILLILFTYVISVFVIHGIESESSVIGALYALGVTRRNLTLHYLTLPVTITFAAGVIGTLLGLSKLGIPVELKSCYDYFSLPALKIHCPLYLYFYGIIVPPIIATIVNSLVIKKELSRTVLSLLKGEPKQRKFKGIRFESKNFIRKFQFNQIFKEIRTGMTVVLGMFISLLIVMLSIDCYTMCKHISVENKNDTKFEYMYSYKYPDKNVPQDGEACFAKEFKKEAYGYNLDVSLLGVGDDNPYFNLNLPDSKNEVVISSAMSQKFGLKKGDTFIVNDDDSERLYAYKISDITQYSSGMYMFMKIDEMRDQFNENSEYYNVVMSDKDLHIDPQKLYSTVTKKDIDHASDIFVNQMKSMIVMLIAISAMIFFVVMYLMLKVMVERSSLNISLFRIFGFRTKELKKLYLNGNLYTVILGSLICIPAAKKVMDMAYPYMVSNVSTAMNLKCDWKVYMLIFIGIIVLYFLINTILITKIKKIVPAEILKNRE